MQPTPSGNASSAMSSTLFDLNLPTVGDGKALLPLKEPSYELARAHALFLLRSGMSSAAAERQPNPEPFVLD